MDAKLIGSIISDKRKALGITQEELGGAVGVSTQAVSKWENGGAPDVELLPAIADKLGVSVDALFGRDIAPDDAVDALCAALTATDDGERYTKLYNILWKIQRCMFDGGHSDELAEWDEEKSEYFDRYSENLSDKGISLMCLDPKKPYYALFLESSDRTQFLCGIGAESYAALFAALSDADAVRAIFYLERRTQKPFTPKLFVRELGLAPERAQAVADALVKLKILEMSVIELDDEEKTVYTHRYDQYLVPFFTFARNLIHRPGAFSYYCGNRTNPYLMPRATENNAGEH
ncbi:MAG: helix-turn-helix transcriptional regulator [Eubacteriales bacterium]